MSRHITFWQACILKELLCFDFELPILHPPRYEQAAQGTLTPISRPLLNILPGLAWPCWTNRMHIQTGFIPQ